MTTYIKNYGITQSYIQRKNKRSMNELKWKADYDGNLAHLDVDLSANGKKDHIAMTLDNDDLMQILNTERDHSPIDQRLRNDFLLSNSIRKKPRRKQKKTKKLKKKSRSSSTRSRKSLSASKNKTISL